jgi:hypothetical protein
VARTADARTPLPVVLIVALRRRQRRVAAHVVDSDGAVVELRIVEYT